MPSVTASSNARRNASLLSKRPSKSRAGRHNGRHSQASDDGENVNEARYFICNKGWVIGPQVRAMNSFRLLSLLNTEIL